jgi:hypothetical protein
MDIKKNILIALFLSIIVFVGSKAFIALFAYQAAEKLKQSIEQDFAATYSWISSELDGTIVFHDLSVTPYRMKRTFYIDRLRLNYGNYFKLLRNLSNLATGSHDGLQSVRAESINGELGGRDFDEWIALEYGDDFSKPLGLYACGNQKRASHSNLRQMGVNEYQSSITLKKTNTVDPGILGLSIFLDRGVLGETKLNTTWGASSIPGDLSQWHIENFQLNSLSLTHVDNGYFRRLSNFCSTFTEFDRAQFSENASKQWQQGLSSVGLEAGEGVRSLYRGYLLQGGQLMLTLSPSKPFVFKRFKELLDKDLMSYFEVSAKLNGTVMLSSTLKVNGQHFKPPVVAVVDDSHEKDNATEPLKSGYLAIPLSTLEQSFQQKVRLEMLDGTEYQGLVVFVDELIIKLSHKLAGGTVEYSLSRDQIKRIEMWH